MARITIYQGYDEPIVLENNNQIQIFNRSYNHNFKLIPIIESIDFRILLNKGYIILNEFKTHYYAKPDQYHEEK